MLIMKMLLDYEVWFDSQRVMLQGPDLRKKHCSKILAQMPELHLDSIQDLGGDRFSVQSTTISSWVYLVHLGNKTCDCPDWPRVNLCKHIATVAHFFGSCAQQLMEVEDVTAKVPSPP